MDGGEYTGDCVTEELRETPLVFAGLETVETPFVDLSQISRTELICPPTPRWQRLIGPILIGTMLVGGSVGLYLLQFVRSF